MGYELESQFVPYMKTLGIIGGLLLLATLLPPAGHSAHHRHCYPVRGRAARLRPLRVMRSAGAAGQPKVVRLVL